MNIIYMARHAQTIHNKNGTVQKATTSETTFQGLMESKILSSELSNKGLGVIYSSDSKRCEELAELVKRKSMTETEVVYTRMLRTRDQSGIEGMSKKVLAQIGLHEKYRGLESSVEVYNRMKEFKDYMIEDYHNNDREGNALIVSHGQTIRSLIGVFMGLTLEQVWGKYKVSNCALTAFEKNSDGDYIIDYLNKQV